MISDHIRKLLADGEGFTVEFKEYPKNPILARFFVNIGYADTLGSGVRNLIKYTKLYSGGKPELIEGDIFKTVIPLIETSEKQAKNKRIAQAKRNVRSLTISKCTVRPPLRTLLRSSI